MLKIIRSVILISIIVVFAGCVRRPSGYSTHRNRRSVEEYSIEKTPLPTRSTIKRQTDKIATSLPDKVKSLANKVERAYRSRQVTAADLAEWTSLYAEYSIDYSLSLRKLSDSECESIEYNLGKIAGYVYRDTVSPVIDELEEIDKGIEDYEERSQKWKGAAKKGFEEVTGVSADDILDDTLF